MVGVLLCLLAAGFSWMVGQRLQADLRRKLQDEAKKLATYVEADIQRRMPAVQRIVGRWEIRGGTPKKEFLADARNYIYDLPGFQALEWVNRDFRVQWIVPLEGNERALGLDMASEENRRFALEKARDSRVPTMTPSIDLVQGGKGFLLYFPIYIQGEFDGFLLAVFRVQEWLNYVFATNQSHELSQDFRVSVYLNDQCVFRQAGWEASGSLHLEASADYRFLDHRFSIRVRPTEGFITSRHPPLPTVIFLAGALLSVLVASVVYLYQKATVEAWRAHAARMAVEVEIRQRRKTEIELQETTSRLALATKAGGIGVWAWDLEENSIIWSDRMYELHDIPPDAMPTLESWRKMIHPGDLPGVDSGLRDAFKGKALFDREYRIVLAGGTERIISAAARVERAPSGRARRITGVNRDITRQKQAEEMLQAERQRLSDILEGTNVGTWEWNIQTGETVFNERWASMIGYTLEELSPVSIETWVSFVHPDDLEDSNDLLEKHFQGELDYYASEARMRHRDGSWIWVLDRGKVTTWTDDGKPLLMSGTHQDITERKRAEEKILHLATHDALTDLPSLRLAQDRIIMAISRARRQKKMAAVMFVDLDGFKAINDSHGHDAGDLVLKEVARRLLSCVRETDTVARIGGDEFLVVLTELNAQDNAKLVAQKAIHTLTQPITCPEGTVQVGASIGIAFYPDNGKDPDSLIKQADEAMYEVKKSGKNAYNFASSAAN